MTTEEAIKWLKVEQCCVSEEGNGKELIEAYDMAIKALEQTKWIPVSEKPQEGRYLCTYEHCDGKCIDFGSFDGDVWYIKPIAYMPLPEPYKIPEQTFGCAED
jgi:hypothetical protein